MCLSLSLCVSVSACLCLCVSVCLCACVSGLTIIAVDARADRPSHFRLREREFQTLQRCHHVLVVDVAATIWSTAGPSCG